MANPQRLRDAIIAAAYRCDGEYVVNRDVVLRAIDRSEAQDTAASSGLPTAGELAQALTECAPARPGIHAEAEAILHELRKNRAALAQPTPKPVFNMDRDDSREPPPEVLRAEQEANSTAWHESIRRAQAEKEADSPEPSLREALAEAVWHTAEYLGASIDAADFANAIIAALPGLSLSAQPPEHVLAALLREVIDEWIAERKRNGFDSYTDSMLRARAALSAQPSEPGETLDWPTRLLAVADDLALDAQNGNLPGCAVDVEAVMRTFAKGLATHPSKEETVVEP